MDDFRVRAPTEWNAHWDVMPNSVRALYGTFERWGIPFLKKEIRIEAWGQLCFDEAACNAIAYHMHNHGMRSGWRFVSWRCEMDGPVIGGAKLTGAAPPDFNIYNYVRMS
jgi:hypothetical protein